MTKNIESIKEKVTKLVKEDMFEAIKAYKEVGWLCEPNNMDKIDLLYRKEAEKEIRGMKEKSLLKYDVEKELFEWEGYNKALQDILDLLSTIKTKE